MMTIRRLMMVMGVSLLVCIALAAVVRGDELETNEGPELFAPIIDGAFIESLASANMEQVPTPAAPAASGTCPTEVLKRVGLCQKVVRKFLAPDTDPNKPQIIPRDMTWSSAGICSAVTKAFPTTVAQGDCVTLADHVIQAARNTATLLDLSRNSDIHDLCLALLTVPVANVKLVDSAEARSCTLAATGGLTGFRVLFMHGLGRAYFSYNGDQHYSKPYDGWLGSWPMYWNMEDALDGIADSRYFVTGSLLRGWDDVSLQTEFCNAIGKFKPHVIFTHSMGNNIIAAAINAKLNGCTGISKTPGAGKTLWFSDQAPWTGSPAADVATAACQSQAGLNPLEKIKNDIVRAAQPCAKETGTFSLASTFHNAVPGGLQLSQMKTIANQYVSGAMCGIDTVPLSVQEGLTQNAIGLFFFGRLGDQTTLIKWGADAFTKATAPYTGNDGLVSWSGCNLGQNYQTTPTAAFYVGEFSHEDGTCIIQDLPNAAPSKKPCTWLFNRVILSRAAFGFPAGKSPNVGPVTRAAAPAFPRFASKRSFERNNEALEPYQAPGPMVATANKVEAEEVDVLTV